MLDYYVQNCSNMVAPKTMLAIIKTESNGNYLAINLNKGKKLLFQPKNYYQARLWVQYLEQHGYDFDVGLAQINIKNIHKYGLMAHEALDPCKNLNIAQKILQDNYKIAKSNSQSTNDALFKTIVAYNSGNFKYNISNKYLLKFLINYQKLH